MSTSTQPYACLIDATRAGCCARPTSPATPPAGTPCPHPVTLAGTITFPNGRIVPAFSCDTHRAQLTDPVLYGTEPAHHAEMTRRRRRDTWLG
jgi:hypothetical protein